MKKIFTTLCAAALLASLTGCTREQASDPSSDSHISSQTSDNSDSLGNSDNSDSLGNSDNSDNSSNSDSPSAPESDPEPLKPAGEPTFLTAPDGTPIYTSEISEIYTGSEQFNDKKTITLAEAEQIAKTGESDFTVKCDGFAYGYIPERALNRIDDPEMFEDTGSGESFEFLGEKFDVNTFEGKCSTEYKRINVGDKFGSLTVKKAYTLFTEQYWYENNFSDVPGAYLSDCYIEFEGEVEMTGYVEVTPDDTLYGEGGDMKFYPDGDSSVLLPGIRYFTNEKTGEKCHFSSLSYAGFFGAEWFNIGNMNKVDCDTSGLHPGDSFVKVKVTLHNISRDPEKARGGYNIFDLKSIEVL